MNGVKIGVLGASGDIGRNIVAALLRAPDDPAGLSELRLAARRPDAITLPAGAGEAPSKTHIARSACDVRNHEDLARFADGLDVVVNATGPSHDRAVTMASAVLAMGADYVDVGGPADTRCLPVVDTRGQTALFHAGALPGASGILPRWFLRRYPDTQRLTVIAGGRGIFTRTGAEDYLAGLEHGDVEPLAVWLDGRRVSRGAHRQEHAMLDEFPDPVSLFPYLDADAEAIARDSGISDGVWYSAMVGDGIVDTLMLAPGMSLEAGRSWLHDASLAMAAGRRPYVVMLVEGESGKVMLHAPSEGVLAAEVAAAAAFEVLGGRVPAGSASAAGVLDADRVLTVLTQPGAACTLVTTQDPAADIMEEGAL